MAKSWSARNESASLVNLISGCRLKILQVYYEPFPSGQTAHVLSLSKGLVQRGHDVTVVLPDLLRALSREYSESGVKLISLQMRKLSWPVKSLLTFLNLLQHERYELVHVHSQEAGVTARWLARFGGARTVFYTPQTIDIGQSQWYNFYILLERTISHFTDRIFSVSLADANRIICWGIPSEKVCVVPNGIDLSLFDSPESHDDSCRQLCLDPNRPVIMQVGRLSPQKDPEMFLKGAKYVLHGCPEAQLVWIGEGPLFNQVKSEITALGLQGNIHLLGRIDRAYRFMTAADVITLTSRWEGMPYSLLEASASSKPVVTTSVNGCPEVVIDGESGYLVGVGDASGWADRVLHLIADPRLARSMGVAGRNRVEAKYSLSTMVLKIERAYNDLVKM